MPISQQPLPNHQPTAAMADLVRQHGFETNQVLSRVQRYLLIAKARWLFLGLAACYGAVAGLFYSFSSVGWFLSPVQFYGMLLVLGCILAYNALYEFAAEQMAGKPWGDHLQIQLDFLCVSLLVYFSGGAASWFWPVYLLVTFEAAILLGSRLQVFLFGLFGGACYGIILAGQYVDVLPFINMPFVDPDLHHHLLYLFLLWCWVSLLNTILALGGAYLMGVVRNEHDRVQDAENRLRTFLDQANDLIFSLTPEGVFLYTNQAFQQVLGYSPEEAARKTITEVIDPAIRTKCLAEMRKAMGGERVEPLEGRLATRGGEMVEVEGTITCSGGEQRDKVIWVICRDVTARRRAQEQLYHMAHHDLLTGLPNRLFFADRLRQAQALAKRQKQQCAVLYLDLDRFKIINDTLGHAVGDQLLQEVARRLSSCVREVDTVARLGGDEFAIVLVNLHAANDAEQVAGKILANLAKPVQIETHELFITTSIGIGIFPVHGEDADLLIKRADVAMYQAKSLGRNNFQIYDRSMDLDSERRMVLERGLRKAIEREEFRIAYQPKIDAETGRVTALEALIRWEHPEMGLLSPADFISLAEETGLIIPIGEWVIRKTCRQNREWQDEGLPKVRMAVNLSGFQLQQRNLVDMVKRILTDTGLSGEYLEFEIAETVIMQNPEFAVGILGQLRDLDIHISIDDFGTGYSSFAHLKRFSINTLKIDRTFVRDIEINSTDAAIATAIISMGTSLNLKVIAEGVETAGQFAMLKERQCDEMQGYLFSRPLPAEQIAEYLRSGNAVLPDAEDKG
ncbi:MAG: EAL domain-containing protein [Desulfuromonadales bacterium]|nr:EAL domain-containing protein [Desulfuromonadales bacterium]